MGHVVSGLGNNRPAVKNSAAMEVQAQAAGVELAELHRRALDFKASGRTFITEHALADWLVGSGFALRAGDGTIVPTAEAHEIVDALDARHA
jgi:hypothetical protein